MNKVVSEIARLEKQMWDIYGEITKLRADAPQTEVKNYNFQTLEGEVSLLDLFGGKDVLFAIHNMGTGCNFCTLWADGLNSFVPHLEEKYSVVLLSKDTPEVQRRFANDRGWRFRTASHGGGDYIREQSTNPASEAAANYPGLVCYIREGSKVYKKNSTVFGPGDAYASIWHVLSLAGHTEEQWQPKYHYWAKN